jgi:membrane-bound lytic murein transglycosylase D
MALVGVACALCGCARTVRTTTVATSVHETAVAAVDEADPYDRPTEEEPVFVGPTSVQDDVASVDFAEARDAGEPNETEPITDSPLDELAAIDPDVSLEALEEERDRVTDAPPTFDIPIEVNDRVLSWVELYSGRMKRSFEIGLARSGRYLETFREIFREAGLPQDLVYMAHVESGYKATAYSRAHARGIFQFMAPTARRYGLRVDYWVDERADPEKSAQAAAAYMKDLYAEFGDWYLALAAYNAGEGKIRRAISRSGRRDFWGIARTNYIRRETKNHVPAILAATLLSKEPKKYGLTFSPDPAIVYDTLPVDGAADLRVLARCAGSDLETLRTLNPALRRLQTPPDGQTDVRLPEGTGILTAEALAEIPAGERVLYARHRVGRGDTLSTIAEHYGVSVRAIQDSNRMGRRTLIRVNQVLLVPTSSASTQGYSASTEIVDDGRRGEVVVHRVRRGDTLYGVSRRYGTTPASIAAASGISVDKTLQIGERLTVVRGVRAASEARRIALGDSAGEANDVRRLHTVRRGDTLWRIASLYRTSVSALCALNQISPNTTIYPGTRLTVRLD